MQPLVQNDRSLASPPAIYSLVTLSLSIVERGPSYESWGRDDSVSIMKKGRGRGGGEGRINIDVGPGAAKGFGLLWLIICCFI